MAPFRQHGDGTNGRADTVPADRDFAQRKVSGPGIVGHPLPAMAGRRSALRRCSRSTRQSNPWRYFLHPDIFSRGYLSRRPDTNTLHCRVWQTTRCFLTTYRRCSHRSRGLRLHQGLPSGGTERAGNPAPDPHRPRAEGRPDIHRRGVGEEHATPIMEDAPRNAQPWGHGGGPEN